MDDKEGLEFAKHVHAYLGEFLRSADQKAAFLLTAAVALLAYLGTGLEGVSVWSGRTWLQFGSTVAVGISAGLSVWAVWPRQHKRTAGGLIAFRDIYNLKNGDNYVTQVRAAGTEPFDQIAKHCFMLSTILVTKYRLVAMAVGFFIAGGVGTVVLLGWRIYSSTAVHAGSAGW